jgi:IS1 transposase
MFCGQNLFRDQWNNYFFPRIQGAAVYKSVVNGVPNPAKVCTSYIERANLTVRLHCKRLARLTLAFSKKLENFESRDCASPCVLQPR